MRPRRHRTLPAALLLVALAPACDKAVTISGTVTVPPEVQRLFSAEQPGKLDLWGTRLGGGATLPYLCAATENPLMVRYQFTVVGCAEEQELLVGAFTVTPDHLSEVQCGQPAKGSAGGVHGEELARGATLIFKGLGASACESRSAVADVTLAPIN